VVGDAIEGDPSFPAASAGERSRRQQMTGGASGLVAGAALLLA
jgi:hypothetical protein